MTIYGKVYCFFEQSGTFKQQFIKMGIPAADYDIEDKFGQTDVTIDLFVEIEKAFGGMPSVFDEITVDDLIIAFFPCTYFCDFSQVNMKFNAKNYRNLSYRQKADKILERVNKRALYLSILIKMYTVVCVRGLRMIIENPWTGETYLKANFICKPSLIDYDRSRRGDYFKKPTAYWFVNCICTFGESYQRNKELRRVKSPSGVNGGIGAAIWRSSISSVYARNFICDFVLGKQNENSQLSLF